MSKLEELTAKLCPDGVEFKNVGDVCDVFTGGEAPEDSIRERNPRDEYIYPIYSNGIGENALWGFSKSYRIDKRAVTFSSIGTIGYPTLREPKFTPVIRLKVLIPKNEKSLNVGFLKYVLEMVEFEQQKSTVPNINANILKSINIPIPPLEVQREIVRILDKFTELISLLQRELDLRRKQYEFYRDQLLTFDDLDLGVGGHQLLTIDDVCVKISSGGTPKTSNRSFYNGSIPWLRTQDIDFNEIYSTSMTITEDGLNNSTAKMIPINCVIVAMYGATAAKVAVNKIQLATNQACCNLQPDEKIVNYRYLYHWLARNYQELKSLGEGSQNNINAQKIKSFEIPIPPIETQKKIVATLDRFDKLCNDLTSGIPAEIQARQKQYEFYRDKLLTFNHKGEN